METILTTSKLEKLVVSSFSSSWDLNVSFSSPPHIILVNVPSTPENAPNLLQNITSMLRHISFFLTQRIKQKKMCRGWQPPRCHPRPPRLHLEVDYTFFVFPPTFGIRCFCFVHSHITTYKLVVQKQTSSRFRPFLTCGAEAKIGVNMGRRKIANNAKRRW